MDIKVSKATIYEAAKRLSNWGRWGADDQIGTLNHVTPADIVAAAKLIRRGKVFALGIPINNAGPQRSPNPNNRFNPVHTMLATGSDGVHGNQDEWNKCRYADDAIFMPIQAATHWDALGHVFLDDKMYNGYPAKLADSRGLGRNGIEHAKDRMVGRGVLLDVARYKKVECLPDGYGISNDELDAVAAAQGVEVRKGDFVLIHTGMMDRVKKSGSWGEYAGGDAAGVKFENCYWCQEKQIAAIITDTWGVEVRPNETIPEDQDKVSQPWHWVVIPALGLTMGEIFDLTDLAADCAEDRVFEFFFCGPPLIITGATGSPLNPQAIK
jgi:kynurenine formamidase